MKNRNYIIQKKILDVELQSTESTHMLQNRLSQLVNNRLSPLAEAYFHERVPEDFTIRLEKVQVDLGAVDIHTLETEIEERFIKELDKALAASFAAFQPVGNAGADKVPGESLEAGNEKLLVYFLRYGRLPWWAQGLTTFDVEKLLVTVMDSDPAVIMRILFRQDQTNLMIERMVHHFSEAANLRVIQIAAPADAGYIQYYYHQIIKSQQQFTPVKIHDAGFKKMVLRLILQYLFIDRESIFSDRNFLQANLRGIATTYGVDYVKLLKMFYDSINTELHEESRQSLLQLIEHLYFEELNTGLSSGRDIVEMDSSKINLQTLVNNLSLLEYYFFYESLPAAQRHMEESELRSLLQQLMQWYPAAFLEWVSRYSTNDVYAKQLYALAGSQNILELLSRQFPRIAGGLHALTGILYPLLAANQNTAQAAEELKELVNKAFYNQVLLNGSTGMDTMKVILSTLHRIDSYYSTIGFSLKDALRQYLLTGGKPVTGNDWVIEILKSEFLQPKAGAAIIAGFTDLADSGEYSTVFNNPVKLQNILQYLIKYGRRPWWARDTGYYTIGQLLDKLWELKPDGVFLLVKESATDLSMQRRLTDNFSAELAIKIITGLPGGKLATDYILSYLQLLQHAGLDSYYAGEFIREKITAAAFRAYADQGFVVFPEMLFFLNATNSIAYSLKIEPLALLKKLAAAGVADESIPLQFFIKMTEDYFIGAAGSDKIKKGHPVIPPEDTNLTFHEPTITATTGTAADVGEGLQMLPAELITLFSLDGFTSEERGHALDDLLHYFLRYNKLPETFGGMEMWLQQKILVSILKYLYRYHSYRLGFLLSSDHVNWISVQYLDALIPAADGYGNQQIKSFIYQYTSGKRFFNLREAEPAHTAKETNAGITMFFLADEAALQSLLQDYLLTGKLPEHLDMQNTHKQDEWLRQLVRHLYTQYAGKFQNIINAAGNTGERLMHLYELFYDSTDNVSANIRDYLKNPALESVWEILSVFDNLNPDAAIEYVLQSKSQFLVMRVRNNVIASNSFAGLVRQKKGDASFYRLASFALQLPSVQEASLLGVKMFLDSSLSNHIERNHVLEIFADFNSQLIAGRLQFADEAQYAKAFLQQLTETLHDETGNIFNTLMDSGHRSFAGLGEIEKQIIAGLPEVIRIVESAALQKKLGKKVMQEELLQALQLNQQQYTEKIKAAFIPSPPAPDKTAEPVKQESEPGERIYIRNAGLVLFHPFITAYFERTALLENREFRDVEVRNRAVLLLQYLVCGSGPYNEFDLVLNKILCGVDINEMVPVLFEPLPLEVEITNELFDVFKERWPKIKNTSVEGIRESFLLRPGVLEMQEEHWVLRVEQRSYDLLLQTLPWAFGYIKTFIMNNEILVEWT